MNITKRSRKDAIQDFQDEIDKFKDNLDLLMKHIRDSNFTVERIDRNRQTLRENNHLLDNIDRERVGNKLH